jgi:hypothetical protein
MGIVNDQDINLCNDCNGYICNNCQNQHIDICPTHDIKLINTIIIKNNNNNFEIPQIYCLSCNKNLENKIENNINYCKECNGSLCKECSGTHNNSKNKHNVKIRKYLFVMPKSEEEIKCKICKKKVINKSIYDYCAKCKGILCDSCNYNHNKEYPSHNSIIFIYIYEKDNLENETNYTNNKDNCKLCFKKFDKSQFNKCDTCKINICDDCLILHSKKYPYHMIQSNKGNIHKDTLDVKLKNTYKRPLKLNVDHCNTCGVIITNKINLSPYICNYCDSAFCNKCINSHYKLYPSHNLTLSKVSSQPNISSKYLLLSSDSDSKCNKCKKDLNIESNESIYYCNKCKIKLCKDCNAFHKTKFVSHNTILLKNTISKPNETIDNQKITSTNTIDVNQNNINENTDKICTCLMCQVPHSKYPSRLYYTCTDCNNYICNLCQKKHDSKFYSHILINPHKFGEEFKKVKKRRIIHRRFASVGAENNTNEKKRDETESKPTSESMRNIFGKRACFKCKIMNKNVVFCYKCNKFYCKNCIKDGQHNC